MLLWTLGCIGSFELVIWDETGEYCDKWNEHWWETNTIWSHLQEGSNEQNKLMSKIEPQACNHGTDWQWPEGMGEGDNDGKEVKGLYKEHMWMTHGHGQQCGNWLWEQGVG